MISYLIERLTKEEIQHLDNTYPKITITPRELENVRKQREIPQLLKDGKENDFFIDGGYGKRTKIEGIRTKFNKDKKANKI